MGPERCCNLLRCNSGYDNARKTQKGVVEITEEHKFHIFFMYLLNLFDYLHLPLAWIHCTQLVYS